MSVGEMLEEKILGVFNVHQLILGEYDTIKPCTLLLTRNRIIVVTSEGVNPWIVILVVIAFIAGLTGLFLRNAMLFLAGLGTGIVAGLLVGLFDFVIRRRKIGKMKKLDPNHILEIDKKNFEVPFANIVKVEIKAFKTYSRGSYLLPSFEEHRYKIDFVTQKERFMFSMDKSKMGRCIDLFRQSAPETIEIEQI